MPLDHKASVRDLLAFERARRTLDFATGAFLPEPATHEPGLNLAQPVVNEVGMLTSVVCASIDLDWVSGFIERSGLPPSTVLTVLDGQGIVQYRSVDLENYVGKHCGSVGDGARARHRVLGTLLASTASSVCTLPSRWSFADSIRAPASRSGSPWLPIAPS